jgi:hypothetical protein
MFNNFRRRIAALECDREFLRREIRELKNRLEIAENGRFQIGRHLDKEGDTVHWYVVELRLEIRNTWTPSEIVQDIASFKTKKDCWEHIRKRRKELKNERPYFD